METILYEWLSLAIRWIHIITAIAWIGASFYFNWLLNHLLTSDDPKVQGELWALHAGGFFKIQKRNLDPGPIPEPMHWFKWEAYWTWISGFSMLVVMYYFSAEAYLLDPSVADIKPWQGILISLGVLIGGWLFYHNLWKSNLAKTNDTLATVITLLFIYAVAIILLQVFSGRGAFLHVGAMLATWMTGSVFFVIMPGQRELTRATQAGEQPDPSYAHNAGLRSLHNNYLTLPVLFCMMSNHYPSTFGSDYNWLILAGLFLVGFLVRHYFNLRPKQGNKKPIWLLVGAGITFMLLAFIASFPQMMIESSKEKISSADIQTIMQQRCVSCHAATPTHELFKLPPKDVSLETEEQLIKHAKSISLQVMSKAMPLGNLTKMTPEERIIVQQWAKQIEGTNE